MTYDALSYSEYDEMGITTNPQSFILSHLPQSKDNNGTALDVLVRIDGVAASGLGVENWPVPRGWVAPAYTQGKYGYEGWYILWRDQHGEYTPIFEFSNKVNGNELEIEYVYKEADRYYRTVDKFDISKDYGTSLSDHLEIYPMSDPGVRDYIVKSKLDILEKIVHQMNEDSGHTFETAIVDETYWDNSDTAETGMDFIPTITDSVSIDSINSDWIENGTGSGDDLQLVQLSNDADEDGHFHARIKPGYFYMDGNEHYLYAKKGCTIIPSGSITEGESFAIGVSNSVAPIVVKDHTGNYGFPNTVIYYEGWDNPTVYGWTLSGTLTTYRMPNGVCYFQKNNSAVAYYYRSYTLPSTGCTLTARIKVRTSGVEADRMDFGIRTSSNDCRVTMSDSSLYLHDTTGAYATLDMPDNYDYTAWHTYRLVRGDDTAWLYIDGKEVGYVSLSSGGGTPIVYFGKMQTTTATSLRRMYVDYIRVEEGAASVDHEVINSPCAEIPEYIEEGGNRVRPITDLTGWDEDYIAPTGAYYTVDYQIPSGMAGYNPIMANLTFHNIGPIVGPLSIEYETGKVNYYQIDTLNFDYTEYPTLANKFLVLRDETENIPQSITLDVINPEVPAFGQTIEIGGYVTDAAGTHLEGIRTTVLAYPDQNTMAGAGFYQYYDGRSETWRNAPSSGYYASYTDNNGYYAYRYALPPGGYLPLVYPSGILFTVMAG